MLNATKRDKMDFLIFVSPILLFYLGFFIVPMLGGLIYAFTDWNGVDVKLNYIGFDNFKNIFVDGRFISTVRFTFSYSFLYTFLVNVLALGTALLLNMEIKSRNILRSIIFSPNVLNLATVGFIWQFILGTLTTELFIKTGWKVFEISWLGDKNMVLFSVVLVRIWQSVGYFMVIYLAGLQVIPADIKEAAVVDGAKGWVNLKSIILPLLMPSFTVSVFISLINALRVFPILLTLTEGGPGYASESISLNIYRDAFGSYQFGYASAKAIVFSIFIFVLTSIQLFVLKRKEVAL